MSESCLFDSSSGAALSVRAMLASLVQAGWDARAATLNCCDGNKEYPLGGIDELLDSGKSVGYPVRVEDGRVTHDIWVVRSTQQRKLRPWELRAYLDMAEDCLESFQPDIVLT